jgi:hypothetical protein
MILLLVIDLKLLIQFRLCSFVLCRTNCIFSSFSMPPFLVWSTLVQSLTDLGYLTATDRILFISLSLTVQNLLLHNKYGSTSTCTWFPYDTVQ